MLPSALLNLVQIVTAQMHSHTDAWHKQEKVIQYQAVTSGGVSVGASEMLVEEVAVAEMETGGVLFLLSLPFAPF